jgi:hypothetical protein
MPTAVFLAAERSRDVGQELFFWGNRKNKQKQVLDVKE